MKQKPLYILTGITLIVLGLLIAAIPLATDSYANYYQARLLKNLENQFKTSSTSSTVQVQKQDRGIFILEIPKLGIRTAVVEGTDYNDLMKGPGWYTESSLPGEGNTAVAGHRTMFGAWFNRLHELKKDDEIYIYYGGKKYVYRVEKVFKVKPTEIEVLGETGYPALTLTTCEPIGSASERLILRARLCQTH